MIKIVSPFGGLAPLFFTVLGELKIVLLGDCKSSKGQLLPKSYSVFVIRTWDHPENHQEHLFLPCFKCCWPSRQHGHGLFLSGKRKHFSGGWYMNFLELLKQSVTK